MSQPKRYNLRLPQITYGMEESQDGEYVRHSDYAALAAENERLRKHRITLIERLDKAIEDINNVAAENERLRKAGDRLAFHAQEDGTGWELHDAAKTWNAAKEGRDAK